MITFIKNGNILDSDAQALVNTVNTVGIMGKGLALQFKRTYPEMFEDYRVACREAQLRPGELHCYQLDDGRWILNLATKDHWSKPSQLEWIEDGLRTLAVVVREKNLKSLSLPALGCGEGGLDWKQVRELIVKTHDQYWTEVDVRVYCPKGGKP